MTFLNIFLIAIALSFDTMAVSAASGARHFKMTFKKALQISFFFGLFHLIMPLTGWIIGIGLEKIINKFDHWVAFLLLVILGIKMILESLKKEEIKSANINNLKILLLLSFATSIDALVIGMTFGLLPVNILIAVLIIGLTTFSLSLLSIYIGKKCGEIWSKKAEIAGGLILIIIGAKILIDHLML